ncbi:exocyst complex component exo84 [Microbotryomycetes sp. JL201]|nr:exocyst complex component exo84 [Microbotryomycetes sp. JL201]
MSRPPAGAVPDSLRTRRPSVGASHAPPTTTSQRPPMPQQAPSSSRSQTRSNTGPPPSRSAGASGPGYDPSRPQSNVGVRLLNKRQSVSYANAEAAQRVYGRYDAPPMPPMPEDSHAGPDAVRQSTATQEQQQQHHLRADKSIRRQPERSDGEAQIIAAGLDVDALASESFKPEDFLKQNMSGPAQLEELRRLRAKLDDADKITEAELQRTVFQNYPDFVIISKEISTLENEMLELKGILEEWRTVPELLEGGWGDDELLIGSAGAGRRNARNSIADLAALYKTQLAALWDNVEGAQKLLPFVPGRHIITESASFIELNSATYKPKQNVHLVLLSDAILVAVKKRRGTGAGSGSSIRLVAERCFNLSEIVVVDLKDGGDLTNAVKIKRGKETIIFRTDHTEDKKVLLLAFKKVAEDLMNKKRKEILNEAEARKGDSSTLRGPRQDYDGTYSSTGFNPRQLFDFVKDDPSGKDSSWIEDVSDEMAVSIAIREFEAATVLIEKGKKALPQLTADPHASQLLRSKLDSRTSELVNVLLHDLGDHSIRKSGVVRITSWLLRLGQGEKARETFLNGRGTLVRKRARQIKFEGDVSLFISELAMVTFTLIKNTCEWYMAAFKDNRMASGESIFGSLPG